MSKEYPRVNFLQMKSEGGLKMHDQVLLLDYITPIKNYDGKFAITLVVPATKPGATPDVRSFRIKEGNRERMISLMSGMAKMYGYMFGVSSIKMGYDPHRDVDALKGKRDYHRGYVMVKLAEAFDKGFKESMSK